MEIIIIIYFCLKFGSFDAVNHFNSCESKQCNKFIKVLSASITNEAFVKQSINKVKTKTDRKNIVIPETINDFYFSRIIVVKSLDYYQTEITLKNKKLTISRKYCRRGINKKWKQIAEMKVSKNDFLQFIRVLNHINFMGMKKYNRTKAMSSLTLHEKTSYYTSFTTNGKKHEKLIGIHGLYSGFTYQDEIYKLLFLDRMIDTIAKYKDNGKLMYWK